MDKEREGGKKRDNRKGFKECEILSKRCFFAVLFGFLMCVKRQGGKDVINYHHDAASRGLDSVCGWHRVKRKGLYPIVERQ